MRNAKGRRQGEPNKGWRAGAGAVLLEAAVAMLLLVAFSFGIYSFTAGFQQREAMLAAVRTGALVAATTSDVFTAAPPERPQFVTDVAIDAALDSMEQAGFARGRCAVTVRSVGVLPPHNPNYSRNPSIVVIMRCDQSFAVSRAFGAALPMCASARLKTVHGVQPADSGQGADCY